MQAHSGKEAGDKPPRYGKQTGLALSAGKDTRTRGRVTGSRCAACERAKERGTSPPRYGLLTGLALYAGKSMRTRVRLTESRCALCKRAGNLLRMLPALPQGR